MALEQLDPEPCLKRVDMPDHRRMMNAESRRCAGNRAVTRNLEGGADLVPVLHDAP
jgi:hypothetical protein